MKKLLAISLILSAPAVFANKVKVLEVTAPAGFSEAPVIHVVSSDGNAWDAVDSNNTSAFKIGLQARCRSGIKRKRQPYRGALHVPGFERVGPTLPADAMIPQTDSTYALFRYADGAGQSISAPKLCMDELARRQNSHPEQSKHQLMAQGFSLEVPAAFTANYTLTCLATGFGGTEMQTRSVAVNSRIKCTASDLAAAYIPTARIKIRETKPEPLIADIMLQATPEEFSGTCPAIVTFNAALTASRPGKVSYRIVSGGGTVSATHEMVFDQAATRQIPGWQRTIAADTPPDLPMTAPAPSLNDRVVNRTSTAVQENQPGAEATEDLAGVVTTAGRHSLRAVLPDSPAPKTTPELPAVEAAPADQKTINAENDSPASQNNKGSAVTTSETPGLETEADADAPEKSWDFVGWEQIEIVAPEAITGKQTRFAVDCEK
ncbi:MAG: hypothetical protein HKN70_11305 [Gammaproteobacteria bacterium]|nr:hypothetical protein [Gammaproteobacteria bacterium]